MNTLSPPSDIKINHDFSLAVVDRSLECLQPHRGQSESVRFLLGSVTELHQAGKEALAKAVSVYSALLCGMMSFVLVHKVLGIFD